MELKIEHLTPYLPYGLGIATIKDIYNQSKKNWRYYGEMSTCCNGTNINILIADSDIFKPILKPLPTFRNSYDLKALYDFVDNFQWCDQYDQFLEIWIEDPKSIKELVLKAPYEIFKYLLSEHYDVFGLIENGLAVDINTISVSQNYD